ncbi:tRNA lysidine(34) synthetase TilS [Sarcina ventriculi]|uniref:tRNA lysidine(34) synthetase TilS n=1 Tax=Sarcina ventriculi TaxID=1267 RepID=UPI001C118BC0|nr:tRNA lysidine(34) synthetase TilS [Sarcina ventriculi]MBU5323004.1 tRNA lysidine(34) synthetase TilS [Sarcina ventriculi]MDD7373620.1 tRNA lysidine(34) synthetase TilS [Sarcina ventriculi]MDO4401480.1 tRNA lysidine(34) synthetase TilS [Clostridiaceae bacterium]
MENKVLGFIKENSMIKDKDRILVALSGGPDSICLLNILNELKESLNITIFAAHVNHCLRGDAALDDENYCLNFCKNLNIPCYVKRVDIKKLAKDKGVSTEMAGRDARYEFFEELMKTLNIDKIAIAHNANDQAETIIMRAIRGTGIDGLVGIRPIRDNKYIRPILCLTRDEIEKYCIIKELSPHIDKSNLEEIYSRNKIRLKAIPYIEDNFNKEVIFALNRLAYSCSKDIELINSIIKSKYSEYCIIEKAYIIIKKQAFEEMDAVITRIIRKALADISLKFNNFEMKHIYDIISLQKGTSGKKINITNNVVAINEYGNIKLKVNNNTKEENNHVSVEELKISKKDIENSDFCYANGDFTFKIYNKNNFNGFVNNNFIKVFDISNISTITIRGRKSGDKIIPLGMKGNQKIKNILIDAKVPKDLRDTIPLILFDNEVAWILGLKTSDKFKVTKNTKTFLEIRYNRKGHDYE